jgi:acyl carrier protein
VSPDEPYFRDHFPRLPIVPGAVQVQAMVELARRLVAVDGSPAPLLREIRDAKFRGFVAPGARLVLEAEALSLTRERGIAAAEGQIDGKRVATLREIHWYLDPPDSERGDAPGGCDKLPIPIHAAGCKINPSFLSTAIRSGTRRLMEPVALEERLKKLLIDRVGVSETKITREASLAEDLGLDSLDAVELAMAMEEEFDLQINDTQMRELSTVADALAFVEKHLIEKPAV